MFVWLEREKDKNLRVTGEEEKREEFTCGYNERETLDLVQPPTPNDDQTDFT